MVIVKDFEHQVGFHCESTAIRNVLKHAKVDLSEEMIIGLGEGIGFIIWFMKVMDVPFIGGGIRQAEKTMNIAKNLNLNLIEFKSTSVKKATEFIKSNIDNNQPLGAQADMYYLPYFRDEGYEMHFAGHFITLMGYDEEKVYVVDTHRKEIFGVNWVYYNNAAFPPENVPMKNKRFMFYYKQEEEMPDLGEILPDIAKKNAETMLNPPIKNIGVKGIKEFARQVKKWDVQLGKPQQALDEFHLMCELGGSGGGLFRKPYSRFLKEAYTITGLNQFEEAHKQFEEIHT